MIDTHCHLDFESYDVDREVVIQRAFDQGITDMITIGCELKTIEKTLQIAQNHSHIYPTIGIHPNDWQDIRDNKWYIIEDFAKKYTKEIVGFGETGLDYYRTKEEEGQKYQKEGFKKHIDIANRYKKPVVVHTRDAEEDTLQILKENDIYKGVIHCFSGSIDFAKAILNETHCMISFSGIITFNNAKELQKVVEFTPIERIMIETDSPFLAPLPYRGKRNEPAYVRYVAEKIAELKNIPLDQVINITTQNAKNFWNIS